MTSEKRNANRADAGGLDPFMNGALGSSAVEYTSEGDATPSLGFVVFSLNEDVAVSVKAFAKALASFKPASCSQKKKRRKD